MRRVFRVGVYLVGAVLLGVAATALFARWSDGPIGPVPGGPLVSGEWASVPADWSEILENGALVEIEFGGVRSVTTAAFVQQGVLHVRSVRGASKTWPAMALANPDAVVRYDGKRYAMKIVRLTDPDEISALAFAERGEAPEDPLQHTTWFFRLEAPSAARPNPAP